MSDQSSDFRALLIIVFADTMIKIALIRYSDNCDKENTNLQIQ